jgi:hypothetical protein
MEGFNGLKGEEGEVWTERAKDTWGDHLVYHLNFSLTTGTHFNIGYKIKNARKLRKILY